MMQEINQSNLVRRLIPNEVILESIRSRIKKNPGFSMPLPAARSRVFSPELKQITESIIRHGESGKIRETEHVPESLEERFEKLYRSAPDSLPDSVLQSLIHVYSHYIFSTESLKPVFRYLMHITGAKALAWMLYDIRMQCLVPAADAGLDSYTRKNFFLGLNDYYLDSSLQSQFLRFRGNLSYDINFKKRFSTAFFRKFESGLFLNLSGYGVNGYLVFFFRNAENKDAERTASAADGIIRDILPALLRGAGHPGSSKGRIRYNSRQMMFQFYRGLREISDSGKLPVRVLFIEPSDDQIHSSFPVFFEQGFGKLIQAISRKEKIYRIGSRRLAVILTVTGVDRIREVLKELEGLWGRAPRIQVHKYPDESANIVNCHYHIFDNTGEFLSSLWRAAEI